MKNILFLLIILPVWLFSQISPPSHLPPSDLKVDPVSALSTWSSPSYIILDQSFRSTLFPPEGWNCSSNGHGWKHQLLPNFWYWEVPAWNSSYAIANDDVFGMGNDGSEDYLVTPPLDLTTAEGFSLTFDSYFDGAYGQTAHVKYSLDSGETWQEIFQVPASLEWKRITIDLSSLSGTGGDSALWIGFHAHDHFTHASGWAIDNIRVSTRVGVQTPLGYKVFIDSQPKAQVSDTFYYYSHLHYDTTNRLSVVARYEDQQVSDTLSIIHHSMFLARPIHLQSGISIEDHVWLYWSPPKNPPGYSLRDPFDSLFVFPGAPAPLEGGCESDGQYIYSAFLNNDSIYKYDIFGNIVGKFTIPGVTGLYDLAYDPEEKLFYGSDSTTTVYEMDFTQHVLIGQFTAPVVVAPLAYDDLFTGFWTYNNALSKFILFDIYGTQLNSFSTPPSSFGNYYGLAYDNWTVDGPFLWGISRDSSGAMIVQFEIATGNETGLTFDASYLSQNSGQASGLYTTPGLVNNEETTIVIGGNLQNDLFFGYELTTVINITPWIVPDNVIGYEIFRDKEYLQYVEHFSPWFCNSEDSSVTWPGRYAYDVRAVYDLTPEGFPGDTGYSALEGTTVESWYFGHELDFLEDWESGTFENQQWGTDCPEKWSIEEDNGNPGQHARFNAPPDTGAYECSLISYPVNAKDLKKGELYLSFDMMMETINPTGNEKLAVELYDYNMRIWKTLKLFSNADSIFNWTGFSMDLGWIGMSKNFSLRFRAFGENMEDILSWGIDNIAIVHSCRPPGNVEVVISPQSEDSLLLTWDEPYAFKTIDWQYDDSVMSNSLGVGSPYQLDAAIRWLPQQLAELSGYYLTKIGFIPGDRRSWFRVKAWAGDNAKEQLAEQAAGNLVYEDWNIITLNDPVKIDPTRELWVGYTFWEKAGYPCGMDDGPCVNWYSNLIRGATQSSWSTILNMNPDLDFSWNILAIFEKPAMGPEGYSIYRSIGGQAFEVLDTTQNTWYLDSITQYNQPFCYFLESIFASSDGTSPTSDTSCIVPVTILTRQDRHSIEVYPNPANDLIRIVSPSVIHSLTFYEVHGKKVYSKKIKSPETVLHLTDYQNGIYILKLITDGGNYFEKIIISHH